MNLISCDNCGVVLDKNYLPFAEEICYDNGTINTDVAEWNGDNYVPFVPCPVCRNKILQRLVSLN